MRKTGVVLIALGLVLGVTGVLWRPLAVPPLTKIPTNVSGTIDLSGTYTSFVDQSTGAPLATPQAVPLTVRRTITGHPDLSTSDVVIVTEELATSIGGQASTVRYQYALDRSTAANVDNPNAWAYSSSAPANRTGSYSVTMAPGFSTGKTYQSWNEDIGKSLPLTYVSGKDQTIGGVALNLWTQTFTDQPLAAAVIAADNLPASIPFATFAAQLKAAGIDLAVAIASIGLTPAELASVQGLFASSIPLSYTASGVNSILSDPVTGAPVDVLQETVTYSSKLDLSGIAAGVAPILAAHQSSPAVAQLAPLLAQLTATKAQKLFTLDAKSTPASITSNAASAQSNGRLLGFVQTTVPLGLGALAVILIVAGLLLYRGGNTARRSSKPASPGVAA
ncbi:MAG: porin PorA family protein [Candidatus Dormibacterales bacterium]